MLFTIFSVFYVLIAAAMIVLILMQRGDGANAGASFGGGSTGTVFGARGAASFLTRTTAVLAGLFFVLSLGMGIYLSDHGMSPTPKQNLGVMAGAASSAPAGNASAALPPNQAAPAEVPASATTTKPAVPPQTGIPAAPPASGGSQAAVPVAPAAAGSSPPASG